MEEFEDAKGEYIAYTLFCTIGASTFSYWKTKFTIIYTFRFFTNKRT